MKNKFDIELTKFEILGEKFFKLRDYTPIPIILLTIYFAKPNIFSLLIGLLLALFGEFIRLYGVAFIGTISRTRSYSNGQLVSNGPFSLIRNPLYLGNLILSVGLSLTSNLWWSILLVLVLFFVQYIPIVAWEERKLKHIFGNEYLLYMQKVPNRWFPSFKEMINFQWFIKPDCWSQALKSEKRTFTSIMVVVVIMSVLYYKGK